MKASIALFTALSTLCAPVLAASSANTIAAPAGAVIALPAGDWHAKDGAQALLHSENIVQLPLNNSAQSYRFESGNDVLNVEQTACARKIGAVFEDCLDGLWESISINDKTSQWSIAQENGNWLIDIAFSSDATFSIESGALSDPDTPHEWADLQAFSAGTLSFDLKVVNFGNNLNGFEVGITGVSQPMAAAPIHPTSEGQWHTYTIPVKELIEQGATLGQIQQGFALRTADGEFEGVRIQLDNIRLNAPIPEPMDWALL